MLDWIQSNHLLQVAATFKGVLYDSYVGCSCIIFVMKQQTVPLHMDSIKITAFNSSTL